MIDIIFMSLGFIALILLPVFGALIIWYYIDIMIEWAKSRGDK